MQLPLGFVIELFLVSYHASPHSLLNYAASFTSLSPLINSHSAFLKFFLHTLRNILIFLCMRALKKKSHVQLCDPMDCSLPFSSVQGIIQARILECVAIPSSRGSSWLRDGTLVSCIAGRFFTIWAIKEDLRPIYIIANSRISFILRLNNVLL